MTASEARTQFGTLLDEARDGPVVITRHGKTARVMISVSDYNDYQNAKRLRLLAELQIGIDQLDRGEGISFADGRELSQYLKDRRTDKAQANEKQAA
ncbi:MAG: type II toxin-antitoxin system Phd/YefM family antitoxin [Pacificimonas sp.]